MSDRSEALEQHSMRDAASPYRSALPDAAPDNVPPGYKQTDVGVFPQNWELQSLAKLSAFITKGSTPTTYGFKWEDDGYLFLRSECVSNNGLDLSESTFISEAAHQLFQRSKVVDGDILITITGNVGRVVRFSGVGEANINQHIARIRVTKRDASTDYVFHYLSQPKVRRHFETITTGQAYPQISLVQVRDATVPLPKLHEQRAIATALSDADALIESLDRLIAKKRAIKQAAMQQLLTGQARLPGFTGEWETKRLGDVGTFYKGQGIRRDDVSDEGVPCIRYGEIYTRYGDCVLTPESRIPKAVAEAAFPLRTGDILFAGSGETAEEIGMCVAYLGEQPAFAGGDIVVLRPNEGVSAFLGHLLNHPTIAQQKARLGQGDAVVHISARNLAQIEMHLPPQEEQTAIATVLSDMDTELEALERRRDKARQIKHGMMQQLLTGQVRLVNSADRTLSNRKPRSGQRKANVHFMRSVFAAEIVDRLHQEPTFGHVKMQKVLFLAEHLCDVDIGSNYHRKAAGPYDNRALRSIDSQMRKQQWFEARKEGERYRYVPLEKRGNHKAYFDRYFHHVSELFRSTVEIFRKLDTERCEIVATLYSAWDDLLCDQATVSDEIIIHEVQNNWHESKKRIPKDRWSRALQWMRENGFVPKKRLPNEQ